MSSSKAWIVLALGAAIGFGAGYGVSGGGGASRGTGGTAGDAGSAAAGSGSPSHADPVVRLAETERALAGERAARARSEETRAWLERELASARERLAVVARSSGGAAGGVGAAAPGEAAALAARDPKEVEARVRALEPEVRAALAKRNGKRALALFRELAALGKPAWPLAAQLGAGIAAAQEEGDGGGMGVSGIEYLKAIAQAQCPDLYSYVLANGQAYDQAFRKLAVWGLALGDASGNPGVLVRQLATETDDAVANMIAGLLANVRDAANVPGLVAALAFQKNPQTRQSLVNAIFEIPGPEATSALAQLATSDPDPAIRKAAESSLRVREAPVQGWLVTGVAPRSVAEKAGLREGDVITAYRGVPIPNQKELGTAQAGVKPDEQVPLSLFREGQTAEVTVKGGQQLWQMGAWGRFTRPTFR